LAGAGSGKVLGHIVQIDADRYATTDQRFISDGHLAAVEGTPLDFRHPMAIDARHDKADGYDLCYLHNHPAGKLARVATVREPTSHRVMEVFTTEPAIIFYTGNVLDGTLTGKAGKVYGKQTAFCLETGRPPDAVNHAGLPSVILRPPQQYRHTCVYRFSTH
jgi:galactose mutarotase-like enzyme